MPGNGAEGTPEESSAYEAWIAEGDRRTLARMREFFDKRIQENPEVKAEYGKLFAKLEAAPPEQLLPFAISQFYKERRIYNYPPEPRYREAWDYASSDPVMAIKYLGHSGSWMMRFAPRLEDAETITRGSLNIHVNPEAIQELDELIRKGKIKARYKFARPDTADAMKRHDVITIYFSEDPTVEGLEALSALAKRHFRGNELLGKKIGDGFYMSEIGKIDPEAVRKLIMEDLMAKAPRLALSLGAYVGEHPPMGLSEGSFYAVQDALSLYGLILTYDRIEGFKVERAI